MSRVFMPQVLRTEVGGVKSLDVGGSTVGEVVQTLTPVAERDEIRLLPAIAGGAR